MGGGHTVPPPGWVTTSTPQAAGPFIWGGQLPAGGELWFRFGEDFGDLGGCQAGGEAVINPHPGQVEAVRLEEQIKKEFEKLHEFLRDEEKALLAQLQEETRHKQDLVEGKIKQLSDESRALLNEACQLQDDLKEDDYTFLMVKPPPGVLVAPPSEATAALGDPRGVYNPPRTP